MQEPVEPTVRSLSQAPAAASAPTRTEGEVDTIERLRAAAEAAPEDAESHFRLGEALFRLWTRR